MDRLAAAADVQYFQLPHKRDRSQKKVETVSKIEDFSTLYIIRRHTVSVRLILKSRKHNGSKVTE